MFVECLRLPKESWNKKLVSFVKKKTSRKTGFWLEMAHIGSINGCIWPQPFNKLRKLSLLPIHVSKFVRGCSSTKTVSTVLSLLPLTSPSLSIPLMTGFHISRHFLLFSVFLPFFFLPCCCVPSPTWSDSWLSTGAPTAVLDALISCCMQYTVLPWTTPT